MDYQGSISIEWGLHQVDNDQVTSSLGSLSSHIGSWVDSHTRSNTNHKVSFDTMSVSGVKDVLVKVLTEIDDGILEVASASWIIALSSGLVLLDSTSNSNSKISEEVATTLHAHLLISVAVHLADFISWDATLSMEAISVLRDDMLEVALVHKLDHRHVSFGWVSLCHVSLHGSLILWCSLTCLLSLVSLCSNFPLSGTDWVDSIIGRSEVSNSSSGRKTSSCESNKVLRCEDHLSQHLDFLVELLWRVEVLSLVFGVLDSSVHFLFVLLVSK